MQRIEENNRMGKTRDLFKKTGDKENNPESSLGGLMLKLKLQYSGHLM